MLDFSKNFFELFGLPVGFLVDGQELAVRYRELQKVVHPDRYAAAGEQSQRLSLQGATLVNEAYETLKDPLKRARYLLTLKGVEIDPRLLDGAGLADLAQHQQQHDGQHRLGDWRRAARSDRPCRWR